MGLKRKRYFFALIIAALSIKLGIFAYAAFYAPQLRMENDSPSYLKPAEMLARTGSFIGSGADGVLKYDTWRTPGYPLFLAVFHYLLKLPLGGIIFLQVFLTVLAALFTYRAAIAIDPKLGLLSAVIVLFDLPITIFSLMILTEALFLFLIALFLLGFTFYLKEGRIKFIILSALTLAASAYVRPAAYYLGGVMAAFIVYANLRKQEKLSRGLIHALIFFTLVYGPLGLWQARNYLRTGDVAFSSIIQSNLLAGEPIGLLHSYSRNHDPYTQGMAPAPYYANVTVRCFLSLMTRPGSLKYLGSQALTAAGKTFGYPWMVFWVIGLLAGIVRMRGNLYYQSMLVVILYFISASIINVMWLVCERLRIPMMPFIAIIAAYGWAAPFRAIFYCSIVQKEA